MKIKQSLFYITTSLFISIFIIVNIIKAVFDYRFIYGFIDTIIVLLFIASIIALIVKLIKSKKLKVVLIILVLGLLVLYLYLYFIVNGIFRHTIVDQFTSPSGKNKLVVIEGGFIDAVYEAYPVKLGLFYQLQDNGYVKNHDDWGGAEVTVIWENDNKAIVKIHSNFTPVEGSNENNEIIVCFD